MNTLTWFYFFLEKLGFPLLVVVTGLMAIVIAVSKVGLRWSAKLVQPAIPASAANERKFCGDLKEISANVAPVQVVSSDKGKLVI